ETGDLILPDTFLLMTQRRCHRRAHACRSHRMRAIVAANEPSAPKRVRDVVETHQARNESTGDHARGVGSRCWSHSVVWIRENIRRRKIVSRREREIAR